MVDGMGMCEHAASIGGQIKSACIDGPEFDARGQLLEELIKVRESTRRKKGLVDFREKPNGEHVRRR
jgi:hypothetical protein